MQVLQGDVFDYHYIPSAQIVLVESRFSINVNKVINISDSHNNTIRGLASSHSYRSETEI